MSTHKKQKGVAIVEFALILPFLLILTVIVIELGRGIMYYNLLAKSVRDAVRYLSIQTPGTKIAEARNIVVYGNPAGGAAPLVPGMDESKVPAPTWDPAGTNPIITTVTIQVTGYTFEPMVANVFGVPIGSYTFSNISATMRSHL